MGDDTRPPVASVADLFLVAELVVNHVKTHQLHSNVITNIRPQRLFAMSRVIYLAQQFVEMLVNETPESDEARLRNFDGNPCNFLALPPVLCDSVQFFLDVISLAIL